MKSARKKKTKVTNPDHSAEILRIQKIIGQLEGVKKMIEDRRYCPQILQQVKAASSALSALKIEILKRHLNECLNESARVGNYSRLLEQVIEIAKTEVRS